MGLIRMRDLLRNPRQVFEELEETGEPLVVTRHGHAVAAIVPVEATSLAPVVAAMPDVQRSRDLARNAVREGRTRSLDEIEASYGASTAEPDRADPTEDDSLLRVALAGAAETYGTARARAVEARAGRQIEQVSEWVSNVVAEADEDASPARVRELNTRLFERAFAEFLARYRAHGAASEPIVESAFDDAIECVRVFNERLFGSGDVSWQSYETTLRGVVMLDDLWHRPREEGPAGEASPPWRKG